MYRVSAINDIGTGTASGTATAARVGPLGAPVVGSGHKELWSSTVTVGTHPDSHQGNSNHGFSVAGTDMYGTATSNTFTHNGDSRTVVAFYSASNDNETHLSIYPKLNDISNATLHIGSERFAFADGTPAGNDRRTWSGIPTWCPGDEITVKLTQLTPPSAPTDLTTSTESSTQIDLSWNEPSKGRSYITGYKIEVSIDGGDNWTDLVVGHGFDGHDVQQHGDFDLQPHVPRLGHQRRRHRDRVGHRDGGASRPAGGTGCREWPQGTLVEHGDGGNAPRLASGEFKPRVLRCGNGYVRNGDQQHVHPRRRLQDSRRLLFGIK